MKRQIRLKMKNLAFLSAWAVCARGSGYPQDAVDKLQPLVATTAHRLAIARQVALTKWDNGSPVEDKDREAQVIASAVKAGQLKGLDQASISNFFRAQIEANKFLQYSLLAEWRRAGAAPNHTRVDLAKTIRPELDRLETTLITEMAETASIRARAPCRSQITQAVRKYVSAHESSLSPLDATALDRAMAAACTP